MKDWKGNSRSSHSTLGARNYALQERQIQDYYATDPKTIYDLLKVEKVYNVWECACGEGHLAKELDKVGLLSRASDLYDRNYGESGIDFLFEDTKWDGWIITNPPYRYAQEFVEQSVKIAPYTAMFLKLQFLEGKRRGKMFKKYPPKVIYVYSSRQRCAMNGNFDKYAKSNAVSYAWYVWERGYTGSPIIKWI